MEQNVQNHFALAPTVSIGRSVFDRSHGHKTTFSAGELIPVYVDCDIMPGDTVTMSTSKVVRAQTLLNPIMDNAVLDLFWYFVPHRLVWTHWRQFCGENTESAWIPQTTYQVPSISSPAGGFAPGTLADYMGLNLNVEWSATAKNAPSALPFRAYAMICNEWFRDENLQDPFNIPTGDANQTGTNGDNYITDCANGGKPFTACKFHDWYTSCLPGPQKGDPVVIGTSASRLAVVPGESHDIGDSPLLWHLKGYASSGAAPADKDSELFVSADKAIVSTTSPAGVTKLAQTNLVQHDDWTTSSDAYKQYYGLTPTNLWATGQASAISISDLRLAVQYQRWLEKLARGGSRYRELCKTLYGVTSPDARMMVPEYLGGSRIPLNVQQVTNTAQTSSDYLGDVGAMSVTDDVHDDFVHSFTEHGTLMCVACVRYKHSYQQGLHPMWTRKSFIDFYQPTFANLSEMPVKAVSIFADAETMDSDRVFGYQEAWSEYRYAPNRISGGFRVGVPNSLATWHLGDYYTECPTLSSDWIKEDVNNVDRVLAVNHTVVPQFFGDFWFQTKYTRPMPVYSVPGLLDHN